MDWEKAKSFTNHRANGVLLKFPNGNIISTIWGCGSYTENHSGDWDYPEKLIEFGSNTVEIMFDTKDERLARRICRKLTADLDASVIGHITMTQWLWVVNQLSRGKHQ